MKLSSAIFFFVGSAIPLVGSPSFTAGEEIATLLDLIDATRNNLEDQQKLLKLLIDFSKRKEAFIADPTSPKLATSLVKASMILSDEILKQHLTHLFSAEFISELNFFTEVGEKQGLAYKS